MPALTRHLHEVGGSATWSEVTCALSCQRAGCGSTDLRALIVPYARRAANMPRRVGELDRRLVDAAFAILDAAVRSRADACATLDVRLALLVVHRYARDRQAVATFWRRAALTRRGVNDGLREPLDRLRGALVRRGWLAPDVPIERTRTWPWNSPTPIGWKGRPGSGHQDLEGPSATPREGAAPERRG